VPHLSSFALKQGAIPERCSSGERAGESEAEPGRAEQHGEVADAEGEVISGFFKRTALPSAAARQAGRIAPETAATVATVRNNFTPQDISFIRCQSVALERKRRALRSPE
jgi:hypothetical protein